MKRVLKLVAASASVMAVFLLIILISSRGEPMTYRAPVIDVLPSEEHTDTAGRATAALMYLPGDETSILMETVRDTLDIVRLPYETVELSGGALPDLSPYETILYGSRDVKPLADGALALNQWLNEGGRLALMIAPVAAPALRVLSGKLGITEMSGDYQEYNAVRLTDDRFPLWDADTLYTADGSLSDYALLLRLDESCDVSMVTGDASAIPLLWTRDIGRGRVTVNNHSMISGKDSRGLALQTLLAAEDTFAYPIINAGLVFIDDFPAPQPEGFDQRLRAEFGYDTQGFFRNRWWPDMKELTWGDGVRYTGVLVETYNDNVEGPFAPDTKDHSLIRYYASELLRAGGEIGLHGYNHMPLCPDGFPYAGEDYKTWPSEENMAAAVRELIRYGGVFLPSTMYRSYVPPSNYLSAQGQEVLLDTLPQIRTISGVYLPETGVQALVQEFKEESDGSVSVPRITSGFAVDEYNTFVAAQSLLLHGVFSHFIHPDDVLDPDRGADLGWDAMYSSLCGFINGINGAYPALRWSTSSEGCAAVQRCNRLTVRAEAGESGLTLTLDGLYDEAWIAVKSERALRAVPDAVIRVSGDLYWAYADSETLLLAWEAEP